MKTNEINFIFNQYLITVRYMTSFDCQFTKDLFSYSGHGVVVDELASNILSLTFKSSSLNGNCAYDHNRSIRFSRTEQLS